jgi:hypothetical protein
VYPSQYLLHWIKIPKPLNTHLWLKAAVVLLRMGAIAAETFRDRNREE